MVGVGDSRGNHAQITRESRGTGFDFAATKGGIHDPLTKNQN